MPSYTFKIQRFIPEKDKKPRYQEYQVELEATDRVLDGLNEIKWRQDGTLTYRRSCAHGVCGSDAMRINGRNRLACKLLIKDLPNHDTPPAESERLQSPEDRARYDDGTRCILCAACTTSCPPFWANKEFVGPAAIVNAHRFIFDSRDEGADERLAVLNDRNGVWRCRTVFNCTDACPRDIEITRAIEDIKRTLLFGKT